MVKIFVCSTQFHIFTSIVLSRKINKNNKLILVVETHRTSLEIFLKKYKKVIQVFFDDIYLIQDKTFLNNNKISLLNKINYIKEIFNLSLSVNEIVKQYKKENIEEIYISTGPNGNNISERFFYYAKRNNINVNAIEDGLSTYLYKQENKNKNKIKNLIKTILKFKKINYLNMKKIFLLNKKLYVGNKNLKKKLTNIDFNNNVLNLMERNDLINFINDKDLIYFSQNFFDEKKESKLINDFFTNYNYYYKRHPSVIDFKNINDKKDLDIIPWEFWCNFINNNIIFVTIYSSAALTPIILYGKLNKVIILYKLLNIEIRNDIEDFFKKAKEEYMGQIFIPESRSELEHILENQNNKV